MNNHYIVKAGLVAGKQRYAVRKQLDKYAQSSVQIHVPH
jgi:hypothetical protein